jgi:hypothetical protein
MRKGSLGAAVNGSGSTIAPSALLIASTSSSTATRPSQLALWLGHESVETTQMYLHADLRLKEQALSRTTRLDVRPGRYRPDDKLLAFLEAL